MESSIPSWNSDRPFLTGRFHRHLAVASSDSNAAPENSIGCYSATVQELIVMDDLMWVMVGVEGRYISIKTVGGKDYDVSFELDASMDLTLQESCRRLFPLCRSYILIDRFVETRSQFKHGLVNQAFASAIRALLLDYQAMVSQLEHQFRLGRLSMQGLWFYCQPMTISMQSLFTVTQKASVGSFSGCETLNLLQSQAKAMSGDNAVRSMLEKMTEYASNAYLGILERWIYEGVIDDPYGEFFITENKLLHKESLSFDYDAKYWSQRYTFKDKMPSFLSNMAGTILTTGKYLNVLRECGRHVQGPSSEKTKLTSCGSNHQYLECIKVAYDFASNELLTLVMKECDLMGKLLSIKHYLFLDQGDFLVHFMDIAREELTKQQNEISVEKLQSLLDLALRSTAAVADPCHEDLTCCVETWSLPKTLVHLKDIGIKTTYNDGDILEPLSITGFDTFCLSYQVRWPLSIVITRKALKKYQLIFRFLFHCKHVDRQLNGAWQLLQGVRSLDMRGTAIPRSLWSMLKFINSLLHYLTFEVLEPNWHLMHTRLQTAKSIDEVIQCHDLFLDKCMRECLLLIPELLKKVEMLKSLCLQLAAATQLFVSSYVEVIEMEDDHSEGLETTKQRKPKSLSRVSRKSVANAAVIDNILNLETNFNKELKILGAILEKNSRSEPYLTHLSQWILSGTQ